jgi:hypothetical protein
VTDVDSDATAFPWRRQAACVQWYAETPSPATADSANQWLASAHEAVQPNSTGGYVNYVEPDTAGARYFADNLVRLNTVRQKYDPDGLMYSGIKL